jgi:hypothetical protein
MKNMRIGIAALIALALRAALVAGAPELIAQETPAAPNEPAVFTAALAEDTLVIRDVLATFPPGTRFAWVSVANFATDSIVFAQEGILEPAMNILREGNRLTFLDADLIRKELEIRVDEFLDEEKARECAVRIGADVIITCKVDEGRIIFEGFGDVSLFQETEFITDENFFRLWTGIKEPPPIPPGQHSIRMSADIIDGCWAVDSLAFFVYTEANTIGSISADPAHALLWERNLAGEGPIRAIVSAGRDLLVAAGNKILFLNSDNGALLREIQMEYPVNSLFAARSGKILAGSTGGLFTVDYLSGEIVPDLFPELRGKRVLSVACDKNETILAVQASDGIYLYDTGGHRKAGPFGGSLVQDFAFLNKEEALLTVHNGTLRKYNFSGLDITARSAAESRGNGITGAQALAPTPFDNYILVGTELSLNLFETQTQLLVRLLSAGPASSIRYSRDNNQFVVIGNSSPSVTFFKGIREPMGVLRITSAVNDTVTITPDTAGPVTIGPHARVEIELPVGQNVVYLGGPDDAYINYNGQKSASVTLSQDQVTAIEIKPDSRPFPVASTEGAHTPLSLAAGTNAIIAGYPGGELVHTGDRQANAYLITHRGIITLKDDQDIRFVSANGGFYMTGTVDTAKVYNAAGELLRTIEHPRQNHIDINHDGTAALTSDQSGSQMWLRGRAEPIPIVGLSAVFLGESILSLSPDRKRFLISDDTGMVIREAFVGREYPVVDIKRETQSHSVITYRDGFLEFRNNNLEVLASCRGETGSMSPDGRLFCVVTRENIALYEADDSGLSGRLRGVIPCKNVKAICFTNENCIAILQGVELINISVDNDIFQKNWKFVSYRDNTFLAVSGTRRLFTGSGIFRLRIQRSGELRDYDAGDDERRMENGELMNEVINATLGRRRD